MKIYTKSGDKGETSLLGGTRVKKYHKRIQAYGTCDELNAWIGLLRDQEINNKHKESLIKIQNNIFTIGSHLAVLDQEKMTKELPEIFLENVLFLEEQIDNMENTLPVMKNFILPGGNQVVSYCHIARTVCRRGERLIIELADSEHVEALIIQYFNRLSDFLFVLSRKIGQEKNALETPWITKK